MIRLFCPHCGIKGEAPRLDYDPPNAVIAEILCPDCCDKLAAHEPETIYRDDLGNQVFWEPAEEGEE